MHRISLLHGDVKLDNVLLKSEANRPLGVAPKVRVGCGFAEGSLVGLLHLPLTASSAAHCITLIIDITPAPPPPPQQLSDFGLTKILNEDDNVMVNHTGAGEIYGPHCILHAPLLCTRSRPLRCKPVARNPPSAHPPTLPPPQPPPNRHPGTVTHLSPEMLRPGTRITTAQDVYAFGITMFEFYTAKRPYAGLLRDAIVDRVLNGNRRPTFPVGAPRAYVDLASACWALSPADRPTMEEVVERLGGLSEQMAGFSGPLPSPAGC